MVTNDQVLPLFGPPKVRVTGCPASMFIEDALRVTGTMVNTRDTGGDCVMPEMATAMNVVVWVNPFVLYEKAGVFTGRVCSS